MNFMEYRTLQVLTLLAVPISVLALPAVWEFEHRYVVVGAAIALVALLAALEHNWHRMSVFFAGLRRYHQKFGVEKNRKVFAQVEREYCYLGVSFTSVLPSYRDWVENGKARQRTTRLLLADPEAAERLWMLACHERGYAPGQLDDRQRQEVESAAVATAAAIRTTLASMAAFNAAGVPVEVRLHQEKLNVWMHRVDGELMYVGMLRPRESGLHGPVLELARRRAWSVFDHFSDEWESAWQAAARLDLRTAGSANGGAHGD